MKRSVWLRRDVYVLGLRPAEAEDQYQTKSIYFLNQICGRLAGVVPRSSLEES